MKLMFIILISVGTVRCHLSWFQHRLNPTDMNSHCFYKINGDVFGELRLNISLRVPPKGEAGSAYDFRTGESHFTSNKTVHQIGMSTNKPLGTPWNARVTVDASSAPAANWYFTFNEMRQEDFVERTTIVNCPEQHCQIIFNEQVRKLSRLFTVVSVLTIEIFTSFSIAKISNMIR